MTFYHPCDKGVGYIYNMYLLLALAVASDHIEYKTWFEGGLRIIEYRLPASLVTKKIVLP